MNAIPILIHAFINVSFGFKPLENLLHHDAMTFARSLNEIVIGYVEIGPDFLVLGGNPIDEHERRFSGVLGGRRDFCSVFIGARQKKYGGAIQTLPARDDIG